jgi:hypothetical protein
MDKLNEWFSKLILGPIFAVIGYFYRMHMVNRERLARLLRHRWIAIMGKTAIVLILFLWFAIWFFTPDESRKELSEIINEIWGGFKSK